MGPIIIKGTRGDVMANNISQCVLGISAFQKASRSNLATISHRMRAFTSKPSVGRSGCFFEVANDQERLQTTRNIPPIGRGKSPVGGGCVIRRPDAPGLWGQDFVIVTQYRNPRRRNTDFDL